MSEHNGAMMQYFHWYTPADGSLWNRLAQESSALVQAGITSVWLPPAYKGAAGGLDNGYGVYDLFDLGEFDQKGSVRTKYGTREEYLAAIKAAQAAGLRVYADVVLNHKMGADEQEAFEATPYDPDNRIQAIGAPRTITAWTHFNFPGRGGVHSRLHWHWWHFNAVDHYAMNGDTQAVYLFKGKTFHKQVDPERGNFDYLMGCNLDINNPNVRKELYYWGEWYLETTGVDGFRFDAVKHVESWFFVKWLEHLRNHTNRDLFAVGEYWSGLGETLRRFIASTGGNMMLFDAALHYNFAAAGHAGKDYDLRRIFDNSLVMEAPEMAVTLVSNHDTQPLQAMESVVEPWFKPLAYALILLRRGGYPCIFAADYHGAEYKDVGKDGQEHEVKMASHKWMIDHFLRVRRTHAFGEQDDYFDDPRCVGWTRRGTDEHPGGLAVLLGNHEAGVKPMSTGSPNTTYIDLTEHVEEPVVTNSDGWGDFRCRVRSVSVWVPGNMP